MALQRDARYPGRWTAASPGHPQGAFKNRTAPGALDGSYIEQDWANDWDGYFSSLLSAASITPNGTVDAVGTSQYFTALQSVIRSAGFQFSKTNIFNAGPQTLTPAMAGSWIDLTNTYTGNLTLPALSSVADGANFTIWSGASVNFNLLSSGADTIFVNQSASVTSIIIRPGGTITITKSASAWVATDGSEQFVFSTTYAGLAPKPTATPGTGVWQSLAAAVAVALVLPAGGTWAYCALPFTAAGASQTGVLPIASVAAGGTTVAAAVAGQYWYGFCWRLQ